MAAGHGRRGRTSTPVRRTVRDARPATAAATGWRHARFDLNPSGGHEGVDVFKQRVGAERLSCPVIKRERASGLFLDRLRKARGGEPVAGA